MSLLLGIVLASACAEPDPPAWRPPTGVRHFVSWEPETLWQRGGLQEDTVLFGPWVVHGAGEQAIVLDQGGFRVRSFDLGSGALEWSFGRAGEGPGEFRNPVDLLPLADGSLAVWDLAVGRLTWLTSDGRLDRMVTPVSESTPLRFCELADGTIVALHGSADTALSILSADGGLRPLDALPWPSLRTLDALQRQAKFAPDPGRGCVYYLTQSTGFAFVGGAGFGPPRDYVEPMAPPGARIERSPVRQSVRLDGYRAAAHAAIVRGDEIWFAFHGESERAGRLIDVFGTESGRYLRSYELPRTVTGIGAAGDVMLLLTSEAGYPVLQAVRAPWSGGTEPAPQSGR